jgi:hypothetical protein
MGQTSHSLQAVLRPCTTLPKPIRFCHIQNGPPVTGVNFRKWTLAQWLRMTASRPKQPMVRACFKQIVRLRRVSLSLVPLLRRLHLSEEERGGAGHIPTLVTICS